MSKQKATKARSQLVFVLGQAWDCSPGFGGVTVGFTLYV